MAVGAAGKAAGGLELSIAEGLLSVCAKKKAGGLVQTTAAMRLAGHENASTHMRYVLIAERLEAPAALRCEGRLDA